MINISKIEEAKRTGNVTGIKKEISRTLRLVNPTMKLIETSFDTLEANRFHFCEKLLKISDMFDALRMSGVRDQCMEFSEQFNTDCKVRVAELTTQFQLFISPQYKLLEKTRDGLKQLKKSLG